MFEKLQHYNLKPCKIILHRIKEEIKREILPVNQPKPNVCDKSKFGSHEPRKIILPKIKEETKEEFFAENETIEDVCKEYKGKWCMENGVQKPSEIVFPKIKEEIKYEYTQEDCNYKDNIVESTQDSDFIEACYIDIPKFRTELKDHFKWDNSHHEVIPSSSKSVSGANGDIPNQYIKKEVVEGDLLFEDEMIVSEEFLQLHSNYESNSCAVDPLSTESENSTGRHQDPLHATESSAFTSQSQKGSKESENEVNQGFLFFCTCCPFWSTNEKQIKIHNLKHALANSPSNSGDQTRQQVSCPTADESDQASENTFSCAVCAAKFTDKSSLEWHIRGHTSDKPFACTDCPARFYKKESLKIHLRSHITGLIYSCLLCPARFSQKISLDNHILIHKLKSSEKLTKIHSKLKVSKSSKEANRKQFPPCSLCNGKLPHKRKRGRPRKDAPRMCAMCPKSLSRKQEVGKEQFTCSLCFATFSVKKHLVTHIHKHSSELPKLYSCSVCPAKFCLKSQLARHSLSHSGEKPFSCSLCPAKFTLESYLATHVLSHSGEKPFACPKCPARFAVKWNLKKHMSIHTVCSQKLNWKARILNHMT